MKTICKFLVVSALVLVCSSPAHAQENTVVIVNARIIDGNGGQPLERGSISFQGGEVTAVGTDVAVPEGAQIIDANGRTVMPGLADMHLHLLTGQRHGTDILGYQRRLNSLVYAGVTTVLDVGNVLPFVAQMSQEVEAGRIVGPRIYYVGPLVDGPDPQYPDISESLVTMAQTPRIVRRLREAGVHAIKAYGGLSAIEARSLVGNAREAGLPVIADMLIQNGSEHFVNAGFRAFAHTPASVNPDTIATMLERDVQIITTLSGFEGRERARNPEYLDNALISDTADPRVLEELRARAMRDPTPDEQEGHEFRTEYGATLRQNIRLLQNAGVPLITGTDGTAVGLFPGEGLHRELELLVLAGLTPLEAISAATKNAAVLMQAEDEWGTLEVGKRADILIIDGRPDENINHTRNVVTVIQRGQLIDRDALRFDAADIPVFEEVDY
ncbi:MAG: amidohydrolase family protein [Erythrobacter sp.]|uniref:amidohydrolase family protein n=1 Tax=Erythrobacter sp. TaxID=1042 RepID=UPI003A8C07BC